LAGDFFGNRLFEELDGSCWRPGFAGDNGAGGGEDDFRMPALIEPGLNAHWCSAPAGGPEFQIVAGDDEQLLGKFICGLIDKRSRARFNSSNRFN
jgi:hypothetical protein